MKKALNKRSSERGGAGVKLLVVALVLFLIGNAGYQWIPVAYAGENFKQEMHAAVLQAMTIPPSAGNPVELTKKRLQKLAVSNSLPLDTFIEVKVVNNNFQARVNYIQQVPLLPFGLYNYEYKFDQVVTPTGFLTQD